VPHVSAVRGRLLHRPARRGGTGAELVHRACEGEVHGGTSGAARRSYGRVTGR